MLTGRQIDTIRGIAIRKMAAFPDDWRVSDQGFKQRSLYINPFAEKLGFVAALFGECLDLDKLYTLPPEQFEQVTEFINCVKLEGVDEPT